MAHIKKEFIDVAKGRDKYLALQLQTLSKYEIVGTIHRSDFEALCIFLKQIGAKFNSNGTSLIWLESLSNNLKKLFIKQITI